MDKTLLSMSSRELSRYDIIGRLIREEINGTEAAAMVGLSTRQVRRLKVGVKKRGAEGLTHGNRGKRSNRRLPDEERRNIAAILRKHYHDFWPTHASEKLEKTHGISRDPKTIRQIMIGEGLWKPKRNKKGEHREWRQRKAHFGEMEQFDGSYHEWFEKRMPGKQCLLLAVDDATGHITHAKFDEHEGVFPVFDFWLEYLRIQGKPMSIYMDRFSTYSMNQKQAKENPDTLTQFQRALEELKVEAILARSPEAKGRVETLFGTLQNRLVKEMRLKNICSIDEANCYLKDEFIPWYNARYGGAPRAKANLHNKLNENEQERINSIFSRQEKRVVQNDFTVSYDNQWLQLTRTQPATVQKKDRVVVEEYRDGSLKIRLRGKYLNFQPIRKGQKEIKRPIPWVLAANYNFKEKTTELLKVGHF